ncbi:MAG: DNA-binding protein WhiA [Clostridia bacterium]|nr:DNA-binding protein WhiA [Clostridia bacterium]
MGYTLRVLEEIRTVKMKFHCCRTCFRSGLLLPAMREQDGYLLRLRPEIADSILQEHFEPFHPDIRTETAGVGSNRRVQARMVPRAGSFAQEMEEILQDPAAFLAREMKCANCRDAFLRGAFLTCGTVNRPEKESHLEWLVPAGREEALLGVLGELGLSPRTVRRGDRTGVYFKDSSQIQDILGHLGAKGTEFDYINGKITRQLKSEDSRRTNYDIRNIEKTVLAAQYDIGAIEYIRKKGKFYELTEPLRLTAQLRLDNPEISLRELALLHVPPVSASGLYHRLREIRSLAQYLGYGKEPSAGKE